MTRIGKVKGVRRDLWELVGDLLDAIDTPKDPEAPWYRAALAAERALRDATGSLDQAIHDLRVERARELASSPSEAS